MFVSFIIIVETCLINARIKIKVLKNSLVLFKKIICNKIKSKIHYYNEITVVQISHSPRDLPEYRLMIFPWITSEFDQTYMGLPLIIEIAPREKQLSLNIMSF